MQTSSRFKSLQQNTKQLKKKFYYTQFFFVILESIKIFYCLNRILREEKKEESKE